MDFGETDQIREIILGSLGSFDGVLEDLESLFEQVTDQALRHLPEPPRNDYI